MEGSVALGGLSAVEVTIPEVLPFQPNHRLGHPEFYFYSLFKSMFSGSEYPKNISLNFEKGSIEYQMHTLEAGVNIEPWKSWCSCLADPWYLQRRCRPVYTQSMYPYIVVISCMMLISIYLDEHHLGDVHSLLTPWLIFHRTTSTSICSQTSVWLLGFEDSLVAELDVQANQKLVEFMWCMFMQHMSACMIAGLKLRNKVWMSWIPL